MNGRATILIVALILAGCESIQTSLRLDEEMKRELSFVKEFCQPTTLPGTQSGFKVLIEAKRKELESVQGQIDVTKYQKLSQELQTYTAKSEILNGRYNEACRIRALCLFRKKVDGECAGSKEDYEAGKRELNTLLSALEQFSPSK